MEDGVIGHLFLCGGQLVILAVDFLKYIPNRHSGLSSPGQQLGQHLVAHAQHTGQVEGALEGAPLGGGLGGQAVPAEVAVPLPVLRVGEVGLAVVQGFLEPVQIALPPGVPVEHQGGD